MTTSKISAMMPGSMLLGVRFKPHASASMLQMPASEIKNQDPTLVDLGLKHFQIGDRLVQLASMNARFEYLDQFFLASVGRLAPPNRALLKAFTLIEASKGHVAVEVLAAATNQSRRHLTRTFTSETGLTTKEFLRITRLRSCMPLIENAVVKPDWAELAHHHGFYDQAHFIGEFKRIVGLAPQEFWIETKVKRGA